MVAILNNQRDTNIVREQYWYRIPIESVETLLKRYWPPDWLAFYQTKIFSEDAYTIKYYAQIKAIQKVYRWQLFPDESPHQKSENLYYKLDLSVLKCLPQPICNPRRQRIVFIPTTLAKLQTAVTVNDLRSH